MNEKQIAVLKAAQRTIAARNVQTVEGKQAVAELVSQGMLVLVTVEFVSELDELRKEAHPNAMEGDPEGTWTISSAREDINSYVLTEVGAAWLNENAPQSDFHQWEAPHYLNAANVYRSIIASKAASPVSSKKAEIVDGFIAKFPTRQDAHQSDDTDFPTRYSKYAQAYGVLNADDLVWFKSRFTDEIEATLAANADAKLDKAAWLYLIQVNLSAEESACWRAWIVNAECGGNREAELWAIS